MSLFQILTRKIFLTIKKLPAVSLLRISKAIDLDTKCTTCVTQNLVQNLMRLVQAFKSNEK